jgi:hypothetical protein
MLRICPKQRRQYCFGPGFKLKARLSTLDALNVIKNNIANPVLYVLLDDRMVSAILAPELLPDF